MIIIIFCVVYWTIPSGSPLAWSRDKGSLTSKKPFKKNQTIHSYCLFQDNLSAISFFIYFYYYYLYIFHLLEICTCAPSTRMINVNKTVNAWLVSITKIIIGEPETVLSGWALTLYLVYTASIIHGQKLVQKSLLTTKYYHNLYVQINVT